VWEALKTEYHPSTIITFESAFKMDQMFSGGFQRSRFLKGRTLLSMSKHVLKQIPS